MSQKADWRPRVGVPWRTAAEETAAKRRTYDKYLNAIREAGGEPVEISLQLSPDALQQLAESLDAVVLSGSPADVDPKRFGAVRHAKAAGADSRRENTDFTLLDHAFAAGKPLLGICYGAQLLNVHLGGSLVQDIPSEVPTEIEHNGEDGKPESFHPARLESGCLAEIAGQRVVRVNSSHHQSILKPGSELRVTARAPDGVVEAIEWTGQGNWVVGVQWHPERMQGDALGGGLFRRLISETRSMASGVK